MEEEVRSSRARVAGALGAGVVLAAVVAAVALSGGGDDASEVGLEPDCVEAWNSDRDAVAFGRHNANAHGYATTRVTRLNAAGDETADGECAVLFGREALDPEPVAAGEILQGREWVPISELDGIELTRVAELQALAAAAPNASLTSEGTVEPL